MIGAMRNRVVDFREVAAGSLIADERNWRRHPFAQRSALRQVLDEVGFVGGVIARETDEGLVLVDGHLRVDLLDPEELIPVAVVDLDAEEAGAVLATYDPVGSMAYPDIVRLNALLAGVKAEAVGFLDSVLEGVDVSNVTRPAAMAVMEAPDADSREKPRKDPDLFLNPPVDKETMNVWPLHIPVKRYPAVIELARKLADEFGFADDPAGLVMEVVRMAARKS